MTLSSLIAVSSCGPKQVQTAAAPAPGSLVTSNSFVDLKAGDKLRILVPLLKSGGYVVKLAQPPPANPGTIVLKADDLEGYELVHYAVEAHTNGKVRLHFTAAEVIKDGKTVDRPNHLEVPFPLPSKSEYVRLIYLVRSSRSDHDMAIVASVQRPALDELTTHVQQNPETCRSTAAASCTWVPLGISVRPE